MYLEPKQIKVKCGSSNDSYEYLKHLCENRANELLNELNISSNEEILVEFWTSDFPELICTGVFIIDENNNPSFELDYSQSTL